MARQANMKIFFSVLLHAEHGIACAIFPSGSDLEEKER